MKRAIYLVGVLAVIAACTSLPYKDDLGFLVSAQADSPEFPVYINGHLCTDMEGNPGLCSKRIKSTEDVTFKFDPQSYAYLVTVACPNGVGVPDATVPAGQPYSFTLTHAQMGSYRTLVCIGEVSPQDRQPRVSAKFEVTITIVDAQYVQREQMFFTKKDGDTYVVLGEFARSAWVYDNGQWTQHSKDTTVKIQGDPAKAKAYSESFAMRFNYLNMGDSDGGTTLVSSITQR